MQGAGNGRQQVDAPLAPLGVSATQESDSGVPQSESEYKGLDELLGKAKRGRDGEKEGGLTWDEESAIVSYKSGDSGKFLPDDPLTSADICPSVWTPIQTEPAGSTLSIW